MAGIVMKIRQADVAPSEEDAMTQMVLMNASENNSAGASLDGDDTGDGTGADTDVDHDVVKYVVELRLPKKPQSALEKSVRCLVERSDDVIEELPGSKPLTNRTEMEQEICTQENWESYIWYRKMDDEGNFVNSNPKEFDLNSSLANTKSLTLTKFNEEKIELIISSPYLREHLLRLIDIDFYPGVTIGESKIIFKSPFVPLYHHMGEVRAAIMSDKNMTQSQRNDIETLNFFVTEGFPAKRYADVRSMISQGFIEFEKLWALFKTGDLVVSKDPIGYKDISQVLSLKKEEEWSIDHYESIWVITLMKIVWKDGQFLKVSYQTRVKIFNGSRKISDLQIYPLRSCEDRDHLRDAAIQKGKLWKKYAEGESVAMMYDGQAHNILVRDFKGSGDDETEYNPFKLFSMVIVDPGARSKATAEAIFDRSLIFYPIITCTGITVRNEMDSEFRDLDFIICPISIIAYNLKSQDWCVVGVSYLKPKEWRPASFDRLVLDQERKDILKRLAKTNSQRVQSKKSTDIIEDKGCGIVLLLHGPPGVGKTLTAEVLSEFAKRPLLRVSLGKITDSYQSGQIFRQIFANAEDWKAIVLIDEAEVVLEKRTFANMAHNSWISEFLRELEYYKGIIILTTNLLDCIDEAFESRISYAVRFRGLSFEDRRQIWTSFFKNMKIFPAYKDTLLGEVDRWSEAEINGRQIRNIILMAENYAASDEEHPRLTPGHIDKFLNATLEFGDFNRGNVARTKKIQLTGPSY